MKNHSTSYCISYYFSFQFYFYYNYSILAYYPYAAVYHLSVVLLPPPIILYFLNYEYFLLIFLLSFLYDDFMFKFWSKIVIMIRLYKIMKLLNEIMIIYIYRQINICIFTLDSKIYLIMINSQVNRLIDDVLL